MPKILGFDLETHIIQPGLLTPPGVCGSFWDGADGWVEPFPDALDTLEGALRPGCTLAVANGVYDFGVSVAEPEGGCHKGRPRLLRAIFDKIERGEVFDVQIAAALNYVADGKLFKDPTTGGPMQFPPHPVTGKTKQAYRYNLEIVLYLLTGRVDAKVNDIYRLRYHEFDGKPIAEWPIEAQTYPVDDARNQFICADLLMAKGQNLGKLERHPWTHLTHQTRAAWAMHLMSTWGLRTNGESVAKLKADVQAEYERTFEQFKNCSLIYWDAKHRNMVDAPNGEEVWDGTRGKWKDNGIEVRRRLIIAYGGKVEDKCPTCIGTGRRPCAVCDNTGKAPSPETGKLIACHGCKGKPPQCKTCGATGLAVPESVQRTPADGIKADRDVLSETDDQMLEEFGERSENEKLRNTYVPFLEQGVSRPVNVRGNVMTDTCRASFEGLVQLLPKRHGVRECFEARKATYGVVEVPDDYELKPGEEWQE